MLGVDTKAGESEFNGQAEPDLHSPDEPVSSRKQSGPSANPLNSSGISQDYQLHPGKKRCFLMYEAPTSLLTSKCAPMLDLPQELLEKVMDFCNVKGLAALEATCKVLEGSKVVQHYAQYRLQSSSRVQRCLIPRSGESWVTLLAFADRQTIAHAQGTAIALGAHHSSALLSSDSHKRGYVLSTFGQGLLGQLGDGVYKKACLSPKCIVGNDDTSSLEPIITLDDFPEGVEADMEDRKRVQGILDRLVKSAYPAVLNAGAEHTVMIACSGSPYSWGTSHRGALGQDIYTVSQASPKQLSKSFRERTVSISAGAAHSLVLLETGQIYACGSNQDGQLGTPGRENCAILTRVPLGDNHLCTPVSSIAAGRSHSVALTDAGQVWTWGLGSSGQLGHASIATTVEERPGWAVGIHQPRPLLCMDPGMLEMQDRVTCISAGGDQTALVTVNGRLTVFGANTCGGLGVGHTEPVMLPLEVSLKHPDEDENASLRVLQAVLGRHHTVVLAFSQGKTMVYTSGHNCFGQLGMGDLESRHEFAVVKALCGMEVISVAAGFDHSAAVCADGTVFMWGRNDSGQLGLGTSVHTPLPTPIHAYKLATANKTLGREI